MLQKGEKLRFALSQGHAHRHPLAGHGVQTWGDTQPLALGAWDALPSALGLVPTDRPLIAESSVNSKCHRAGAAGDGSQCPGSPAVCPPRSPCGVQAMGDRGCPGRRVTSLEIEGVVGVNDF